jgi:hypothetical protein
VLSIPTASNRAACLLLDPLGMARWGTPKNANHTLQGHCRQLATSRWQTSRWCFRMALHVGKYVFSWLGLPRPTGCSPPHPNTPKAAVAGGEVEDAYNVYMQCSFHSSHSLPWSCETGVALVQVFRPRRGVMSRPQLTISRAKQTVREKQLTRGVAGHEGLTYRSG